MGAKKDEMKTYIIETFNGTLRKITVPASWKVTYGPLIAAKQQPGAAATLALRFYEGKEHQRAIFTDVKSFRDESIPLTEKVTRTKQQTMRKDTPQGSRDVVVEARVSEWIDPDKPEQMNVPPEFLQIADNSGGAPL